MNISKISQLTNFTAKNRKNRGYCFPDPSPNTNKAVQNKNKPKSLGIRDHFPDPTFKPHSIQEKQIQKESLKIKTKIADFFSSVISNIKTIFKK